jgi:hypothetical protein
MVCIPCAFDRAELVSKVCALLFNSMGVLCSKVQ